MACVDCRDLGYVRCDVPVGAPGFGKLVACPTCSARSTSDRATTLRALSNLRGVETEATFDGVKRSPSRDQAVQYARDILARGGWLTMYGSYGAGKSYLAAATCNAALAAGKSAAMYTVQELLDTMMTGFDDDRAANRAAHALNADVLVLDEFEKAYISKDWARAKFQELVIARYRETAKATIWICNVDDLARLQLGGDTTGALAGMMTSRASQYWMLRMTDADVRPAVGRAWKAALTA